MKLWNWYFRNSKFHSCFRQLMSQFFKTTGRGVPFFPATHFQLPVSATFLLRHLFLASHQVARHHHCLALIFMGWYYDFLLVISFLKVKYWQLEVSLLVGDTSALLTSSFGRSGRVSHAVWPTHANHQQKRLWNQICISQMGKENIITDLRMESEF